jgi:hypothetical protein
MLYHPVFLQQFFRIALIIKDGMFSQILSCILTTVIVIAIITFSSDPHVKLAPKKISSRTIYYNIEGGGYVP